MLICLQYILVSNTYRLKNKEFHFEYSNSLYDNYEKCIDKGIIYNDAHLVIDTMLIRFKEMIEANTVACHDLKDEMLSDFVEILQQNDDLPFFLSEYQEKVKLNTKLEYAIVLRHLGIFLDNKKVYDELHCEEIQDYLTHEGRIFDLIFACSVIQFFDDVDT